MKKILKEYSVKVCKIDSYFYEHYGKVYSSYFPYVKSIDQFKQLQKHRNLKGFSQQDPKT